MYEITGHKHDCVKNPKDIYGKESLIPDVDKRLGINRVFTDGRKALIIEHIGDCEQMSQDEKLSLKILSKKSQNLSICVTSGTPEKLDIEMLGNDGLLLWKSEGSIEFLQKKVYDFFGVKGNSDILGNVASSDCACEGHRLDFARNKMFSPLGIPSIPLDCILDDSGKRILFIQHFNATEKVSFEQEYHLRNLARLDSNISVWITRGTQENLRVITLGSNGLNRKTSKGNFAILQNLVSEWAAKAPIFVELGAFVPPRNAAFA